MTRLERSILDAMGSLGREPKIERVFRKTASLANLDCGNQLDADRFNAAFAGLIYAKRVVPGTRGGWRLNGDLPSQRMPQQTSSSGQESPSTTPEGESAAWLERSVQ